MNKNTSEKMKLLITGGAGFIGSHLAEKMLRDGFIVKVIDDLSTGSLSNISHLENDPDFSFHRYDILEDGLLEELSSDTGLIIHLAAAVGVMLIVEHPVRTIETNVSGTEIVLKAGLKNRNRVLIASSSEVYGKGNNIPFNEDDDVLLGSTKKSRWSYAASKMIDEFLAMAYWNEHDLETVSFRLFNTIGSRQTGRYGMVVPRFIRQALKGEPITVFGDGSQSRCFCDVRDVIEGISRLAFHPDAPGNIFNIGSTEEITILELAHKIKKLTGSGSKIQLFPYEEAYAPGFEDLHRRVPDTTGIHKLTGWDAGRRLDDVLVDIIEYEKDRLDQ